MKNSLDIKDARDFYGDIESFRINLDKIMEKDNNFASRMNRLARVLAQKRRSFFLYNQEDGIIDTTKFTKLVVNPTTTDYYKKEKDGEIKSTCITFLIDPVCMKSKSLREEIVSIMDVVINDLESSEVSTEVYSYNDDYFLCFKGYRNSWILARETLALLLGRKGSYKEDFSEEAVKMAVQILRRKFEENKFLFFITRKEASSDMLKVARKNRVHLLCFRPDLVPNVKNLGLHVTKRLADAFKLKITVINI